MVGDDEWIFVCKSDVGVGIAPERVSVSEGGASGDGGGEAIGGADCGGVGGGDDGEVGFAILACRSAYDGVLFEVYVGRSAELWINARGNDAARCDKV